MKVDGHIVFKDKIKVISIILDWFRGTPPPIRGQNIKFVPILLLLTSHFMFGTYQGLAKVGVSEL